MAKKFFAILNTQTTIIDTVADLAIVICDREGRIFNQCSVLISDQFLTHDLFYEKNSGVSWSCQDAKKIEKIYDEMLEDGRRILIGEVAINKWIGQCIGKYDPTLTSYDLAVQKLACKNTGINLTEFSESFCLSQAAVDNICNRGDYKEFCLLNNLFDYSGDLDGVNPRDNIEMICGFVNGKFKKAFRTALEDVLNFELPIFIKILKTKNWRQKVVFN